MIVKALDSSKQEKAFALQGVVGTSNYGFFSAYVRSLPPEGDRTVRFDTLQMGQTK